VISLDSDTLLTDDVSNAIPDQIHSRDCGLLSVSGDITRDQTKQRNERRGTSLREIVSRKTSRIVSQRQSNDENHAQHSSAETNHRDENAVSVLVACPAANNQEDDFNCAAGCAVEKRFLGRVAEADDQLGEEVRDATCAGYISLPKLYVCGQ
jgi:hypothetical protein